MRNRKRRYRRPRSGDKNGGRIVKEVAIWAGEILIVIALAGILVYFFGVRVPVTGQSMYPVLDNGDQVLVNRFIPHLIQPKANDIIAFLPNGNQQSHYSIKRVIAVPGDTVQIKDGKIYVNDELFVDVNPRPLIENAYLAEEPVTVGEDEYFVLGDNRNSSEDSRYANIGNIKREYIKGKAWFIIAPFTKIGGLK
ncbi:signal peptidase I [Clostridia bacterium]|nr:signal peptidase I [Clostridia bacterium]